jgi:hypothetical protein
MKHCCGCDDELHRLEMKIAVIETEIHRLEMKIAVIETEMKHTLMNKHAESLAVARAIDLKFKWISVFVGGIATIASILGFIGIASLK